MLYLIRLTQGLGGSFSAGISVSHIERIQIPRHHLRDSFRVFQFPIDVYAADKQEIFARIVDCQVQHVLDALNIRQKSVYRIVMSFMDAGPGLAACMKTCTVSSTAIGSRTS